MYFFLWLTITEGDKSVQAPWHGDYLNCRNWSTNSYFFLSFSRFFLCEPFLKSLLIFYNIASVLCFGFLAKACGILVPQPGIRLTPLALEDKVLTTGRPVMSLDLTTFLVFSGNYGT